MAELPDAPDILLPFFHCHGILVGGMVLFPRLLYSQVAKWSSFSQWDVSRSGGAAPWHVLQGQRYLPSLPRLNPVTFSSFLLPSGHQEHIRDDLRPCNTAAPRPRMPEQNQMLLGLCHTCAAVVAAPTHLCAENFTKELLGAPVTSVKCVA